MPGAIQVILFREHLWLSPKEDARKNNMVERRLNGDDFILYSKQGRKSLRWWDKLTEQYLRLRRQECRCGRIGKTRPCVCLHPRAIPKKYKEWRERKQHPLQLNVYTGVTENPEICGRSVIMWEQYLCSYICLLYTSDAADDPRVV